MDVIWTLTFSLSCFMAVVTTFSKSFLDSSARWLMSLALLLASSNLLSMTAIWSGDSLLRFSSRNFLVLVMTSFKALAFVNTSFCRALTSDRHKAGGRVGSWNKINLNWWKHTVLKEKGMYFKPDAPAGTAADLWHSQHFQPVADDQSDGFLSGWDYHTLPPTCLWTLCVSPIKTVQEEEKNGK